MWSPNLAAQLRLRGHDVVAVVQRSDLRGKSDAQVFATAQVEERVIVTENVSDFHQLAQQVVQHGRSHAGLIYTSNRRFPRHDRRVMGRLVTTLANLLSAGESLTNQERWLL